MFVDFQKLKQLCSLEQVALWLGLDVKGGRCTCPVNDGDKRELVLTYDKGMFFCFGCKKRYPNRKNGGDQIALVQHVLDYPEDNEGYKQAAAHLQTRFHGYTPAQKGLPAEGLDYLISEHPDVQALGLSPGKAEELGIGFAPRGTMIRRVLFPLRDRKGTLLGYLGYAQDGSIRLPKSLVQ
jgi:hypothetical protein